MYSHLGHVLVLLIGKQVLSFGQEPGLSIGPIQNHRKQSTHCYCCCNSRAISILVFQQSLLHLRYSPECNWINEAMNTIKLAGDFHITYIHTYNSRGNSIISDRFLCFESRPYNLPTRVGVLWSVCTALDNKLLFGHLLLPLYNIIIDGPLCTWWGWGFL